MIVVGKIREWLYGHKWILPVELPAFVLSVGNISLGGTGKSAFVMLLAEWAEARKIPVLVLSRGYKRKSRSLRILGPGAPLPEADEIGDEPWMIKHRVPSVGLLVHPDRARQALRHWGQLGEPRLVLLDDAFQHWRCARDFDVLMIDATESLEQKVLPFGRLRETVRAARRADLIVITRALGVPKEKLAGLEARLRAASWPRAQPTWKRQTRATTRVIAGDYECAGFRDAVSGESREPERSRDYLIVSGIAKPDHLRAVVQRAGLKVAEELYFPDHHRLSAVDTAQIRRALARHRGAALLVTEKDSGRWRALFGPSVPGLVFCVRFAFLGNGAAELESILGEVEKEARCFTSP